MASDTGTRGSGTPVYIEEPAFSRRLFGSSAAAWIWLVARLWLGWEWLQAGWSKVLGGNITWKFWDWGDPAYSLTGDGNIGWLRSGTVAAEDGGQRTLQGATPAGTGWTGSSCPAWAPPGTVASCSTGRRHGNADDDRLTRAPTRPSKDPAAPARGPSTWPGW
jgi:hypothetical protein